ncbi:hypothetical protein FPV16_20500 [Methylobacterium sp. W2]|uniref:hypothetical protein n=1 Tax=Methylobacterium sp. W2 TaxID=2598107 RepID=UPI001D0C55BF|nr:hypothetical protein [Methylobacterium sp. W2]MCC0808557.1 hypothetical protein [Methylobacterium sp. W2]
MTAPDPILAVIADHRAADDALTLILETLDEDDEEAMRAHNLAADRCLDARRAMNGIVPVTMGGLQALVAHYVRYEEYTDGFERIGAALEGCESTLRFSALQRGKAELHEQVVSANRPTVSEAVSAHRAAYDAFQVAPDENVDLNAVLDAQSAMQTALNEMLTTPCVSRLDALALRSHLQWWLADEAEFEADYQPAYAIAQARAAELTMLLDGGVP